MDIQMFNNPEFGSVRTLQINNEPWFVGKDVAQALKYRETANMRKLIEKEDYQEIDPQSADFMGFVQNGTTLEPNRNIRRMLIINESGLYSAIFNSKLPRAKEFKRWVTSEVLPSIRKHGVYAVEEVLKDPDLLINALQELKAERAKRTELERTTAIQQQQIAELKPKATYYDLILQNRSLVSITQIAKDYGMSGKTFNDILHELGVQYKLQGTWILYQKYANKGYTSSRTYLVNANRCEVHTYWTQKGRLFIYELLKTQKNILPMIERGA